MFELVRGRWISLASMWTLLRVMLGCCLVYQLGSSYSVQQVQLMAGHAAALQVSGVGRQQLCADLHATCPFSVSGLASRAVTTMALC